MRASLDTIYRRGEEGLCGIQVMTGEDHMRSHDAMHVRSEVVAKAAIASSRRGDGRFIEGDAIITRVAGPATVSGEMQRMTRVIDGIADLFAPRD